MFTPDFMICKLLKIGKTERRINLTLEGPETFEQVENFRYLGGLIKSNGRCTEEIRSRIGYRNGEDSV
jgi:hypothetical protein